MKRTIITFTLFLSFCWSSIAQFSGSCGDSLLWSLDTTSGVLTITGTGAMDNYSVYNKAPWYRQKEYVTSVVLPYGLTTIGNSAFMSFMNLDSITIPSTVTTLGSLAFHQTNISSITIPASVTSINYRTFCDCPSLTSYYVEASNPNYCSSDGILYNKTQTRLIKYPCAKNGSSFSIPTTVTVLAQEAFRENKNLTTITIHAGVTTINPIYYCEKLEAINVNSSNTQYCSVDGVVFSKNKQRLVKYPDAKPGSSYSIPSTTQTLGNQAFAGNKNLSSLTIPSSIASLGTQCFWGVESMDTIIIPASVTTIGYACFDSPLSAILVSSSNPNYCSQDGVLYNKTKTILLRYPTKKTATSFTIPSTVQTIEKYSFLEASNLINITIPNSVTIIGLAAFNKCANLLFLNIPSSVDSIGSSAFDNCPNILDLIFNSPTPPRVGTDVFFYNYDKAIAVPCGARMAYSSNPIFGQFSSIIEQCYYNVTINSSDASQGTATGGNNHVLGGTILSLSATPSSGFAFLRWNDGNTDNPRNYLVSGDTTISAQFVRTYSVSTSATDGGSATGNGTYIAEATATLTATPNSCYRFDHWNDGDTTNPRSITVNGDSTFRAYFTTLTDTILDTVSACDSYSWKGTIYSSSNNTASHTYTNQYGCDSVVSLNLTINLSSNSDTTATVCDNFTWHGINRTASGNYNFVTTNAKGCDSTRTLHLTVNTSNTGTETHTECDSYTWHGTPYTASTNTPTFTETNSKGCDSVVTLHLTINHRSSSDTSATVCNSFTWHGVPHTVSGNFNHVTLNASGCDSTRTLHLTVNTNTTGDTTAFACETFTWNGNTYSSSTSTPTKTIPNAAGCDSVVTLRLTVNHHSTGIHTATACDSYSWHGMSYTASTNTPTFTETNSKGCDSVVTLHLTINPSTSSTQTEQSCERYTWFGRTYIASTNTATHTLTNRYGCDSVITLHLTIYPRVFGTHTVNACDSYTWDGITHYTDNHTTTQTFTSYHGCDSVVRLDLTLNYSSSGIQTINACDSYTWYGNTFTSDNNTATHTLRNRYGCDSVVTLNLTVNRSTSGTSIISPCNNYHAPDGTTIIQDGTYNFLLANSQGCDSTATVILYLRHGSSSTHTIEACESYTWNGATYTQSNHTDSLVFSNGDGCDSVIYLDITIHHGTTTNQRATVCDRYTGVGGEVYTVSGDYSYVVADRHGCDSTIVLHLIVNHSDSIVTSHTTNGLYTWSDGVVYTESDTLTNHFTNRKGCDSIVTLYLTINDLPLQIVMVDKQHIIVNHFPNGQGEPRVDYLSYRWYHNGAIVRDFDNLDYYSNTVLNQREDLNGRYYVMVPTDNTYHDWYKSNVINTNVGIDDAVMGGFEVWPTMLRRGNILHIDATGEWQKGTLCRIYDMKGTLVKSFDITSSENSVAADLSTGTYMVMVQTSTEKFTYKIVVL